MEKIELNEVASVVEKYLSKSGKNVAYIDYSAKIQEYLEWYRGNTKWHKYHIYNGTQQIEQQRASLGMAKAVCEDWASLLMNEKVAIKLEDDKSQEFVDKVLEDNNFGICSSQFIELSMALGTGAITEMVELDNEKYNIKLDFIHGDMIFPLSWDNGVIKECAFIKVGGSQKEVKYTIILMEKGEDGNYWINTAEVNTNGTVVQTTELGENIDKAKYSTMFNTKEKRAPFQIVKPNIVNNYDKTNPLGMSVFGNSIDILKSIDTIYDSFENEYNLGRKRIFVKSNLKSIKIEYGDTITSQIDPNDTVFYQLDWTGEHNDKPPIYETDLTLREVEHTNGLDTQLKLLARKVGLGENFYSFVNGAVARTATEIVSTNSTLFKNKKKNDKVIKIALIDMTRAILTLANQYNLGTFNVEQKISIDFDDGIIEDRDKEFDKALKLYNAGLIDKVDFFIRVGEYNNREQSAEYIKKMQESDTMREMISFGGDSLS